MSWKPVPRYPTLLLLPVLLLTATAKAPPRRDCSHDIAVSTAAKDGDLWSSLGGKVSFHEDGAPYVRLTFAADPAYLRFDRDASLRARVDFSCLPDERPQAIRFEMRFSQRLAGAAELNDVMLLGEGTHMLAGAGVPAANQWFPVRLVVPAESPSFHAIHFGAGSAWAREYPGATIHFDLRNVVFERRQWLHAVPAFASGALPQWRNPDDPAGGAGDATFLIAAGAPEFALIDFSGDAGGTLRVRAPAGVGVEAWVAEWLAVEQKTGVVEERAVRLLPYRFGTRLPPQSKHARRFWLRISARQEGASGPLVLHFAGQQATGAVEVLPIKIPPSPTRHLMYYQMNENWTGYAKYAAFYRNAPAHFEQLSSLGFTGVHIAEEPQYSFQNGRFSADFSRPGRYWQKWPLPLGTLAAAAQMHGLHEPLVWEGLRIFTRDDVWAGLQSVCACERTEPPIDAERRLAVLAAASASGWKRLGQTPYLSVADEPGVHTEDEVAAAGRRLQNLRAAGHPTFLTTHARMHDSFHRLAAHLDINALHAEDVTSGAWQVPRRFGGELWLYNGGSFNVTTPGSDRFFAGLYGWLARASGTAQWIYTRPSQLTDPLDLRQRLSADAQFYALPGNGDQPAATPGLLGLAAGIVDRRILDYAETRAKGEPELAKALQGLRESFPLPAEISEYTPARLRKEAHLAEIRKGILKALAK